MTPTAATLGLAAAAGLALGSFAVTAGMRFSRGESVLTGRSRCDDCGRPLSFGQTLPLVAYARQGGTCVACQGRIDPIHPIGEVAGAIVLLSILVASDPIRGLILAVLGLLLVSLAAVDLKVRRLPDLMTAGVAVLAVGLAVRSGLGALAEGLATAGVVLVLLLGLRWVSARRGRDPGLGLGDVKLAAALAIWLGAMTPWAIVGASLVGLAMMRVMRPADGRLPFGPALAVAAWAVGIGREADLWPNLV